MSHITGFGFFVEKNSPEHFVCDDLFYNPEHGNIFFDTTNCVAIKLDEYDKYSYVVLHRNSISRKDRLTFLSNVKGFDKELELASKKLGRINSFASWCLAKTNSKM